MEFLEKNSTRSFRLLFIYSNICDKDHYDDPQIRLAEVLLIQAPSKTDSLLAFRMTMLKLWNYSIPKELAYRINWERLDSGCTNIKVSIPSTTTKNL